MSANLSAIFYLVSGVLFILALRGLSSPETSRQGNLFSTRNDYRNSNILSTVIFLHLFCSYFFSRWILVHLWLIGSQ